MSACLFVYPINHDHAHNFFYKNKSHLYKIIKQNKKILVHEESACADLGVRQNYWWSLSHCIASFHEKSTLSSVFLPYFFIRAWFKRVRNFFFSFFFYFLVRVFIPKNKNIVFKNISRLQTLKKKEKCKRTFEGFLWILKCSKRINRVIPK